MRTYKQLTIDGLAETKRVWVRDKKGKFSKKGMSNEERLYRENNVLKAKNHSLERQLKNKDFQLEALENKLWTQQNSKKQQA